MKSVDPLAAKDLAIKGTDDPLPGFFVPHYVIPLHRPFYIFLYLIKNNKNMLDSLKEKVRTDISVLEGKIKKNQDLIEKRSRKTLDIIAADNKAKEALQKDLTELENLTKAK